MAPEPLPADEATRGRTVEATLWNTVARLRARGWHISLWEIQRAQDVIAYLFARLGRAPTDDELHRHLRPILCGRESELAPFSEVFQGSTPTAAPAGEATASGRRRRRGWVLGLAVMAVLTAVAGVVALLSSRAGSSSPGSPGGAGVSQLWTVVTWTGVVVGSATAATGLLWLALRKRLRRRPAPRDPGHDLELRWATEHPLDTVECVRIARSLRVRARERGQMLDVPRTVDASIRAGLRLRPCFVEHKRVPEYLAVIEQRSAHDVLAAYHARAVEQVGVHGVAVRRVGLLPHSALVVDPVRGRRRLDALQPTSERERLLLFAADRSLRDPFSGRARPWLGRLERWSETIQIGPDVDGERSLPGVDRVLTDMRCLDPLWTRCGHDERSAAARPLPAVFESGDELWIEPCAPSNPEVARALDLLMTSLGPDGWYWLSACALYPEISYEVTVALGRLLKGAHGEPVAAHLDVAVLARLPWFRHAYMPDWLRSALISTLPPGRLLEAREALDQVLVSGLVGASDAGRGLSVAEPGRGAGRGTGDGTARQDAAVAQDRVYLDGSALRRRRLAAAAPPQLVAALRRQRSRVSPTMPAADAPAPRVRRALAWINGLLVVAAVVSSGIMARLMIEQGVLSAWWQVQDQSIDPYLLYISLVAFMLAVAALVFSLLARRPRGAVVGGSSVVFHVTFLFIYMWGGDLTSTGDVAVEAVRVLALGPILGAPLMSWRARPVQWPTFAKRNRIVFLIGVGTVITCALWSALLGADFAPAWMQPNDPNWSFVIELAVILALLAGGAVVLAAAYFAGVRLIPLGVGAAVVAYFVVAGGDVLLNLGLICLAALVVFGGFYWQLRRTAEQPPLEFWETRWRAWRWPLAGLTVAATVMVAWYFSRNWAVALAFGAVPAAVALLDLADDLASDHLAGVVRSYRLRSRFPLRLD